MWLVFAIPFSHLFLNVIDEVFVPMTVRTHEVILVAIAGGALLIGAWMGRYEDLRLLAKD